MAVHQRQLRETGDRAATAPALERLADYELLEEIGRGGWGWFTGRARKA